MYVTLFNTRNLALETVEKLEVLMAGALPRVFATASQGTTHTNPLCPVIDPGDDALPRIGDAVEMDLKTMISAGECAWCRNYFADHGSGTRSLAQLAKGPLAFGEALAGRLSRGEAISELRVNWLVPETFVAEALDILCDGTCRPDSGMFALVDRSLLTDRGQGVKLEAGLWHWVDGWSIVPYDDRDQWRKSLVLGYGESSSVRETARTYAEITQKMFKDQTEAWSAARCIQQDLA